MTSENQEREGESPLRFFSSGVEKYFARRREHQNQIREFDRSSRPDEFQDSQLTFKNRIAIRFLDLLVGTDAAQQLFESDEPISIHKVYRNWRRVQLERREENKTRRQEILAARKEHREALRESRLNRYQPSLTERICMILDYDPTHNELGETGVATFSGALIQFFSRVIGTRILEIMGVVFVCAIGYFCYWAISQT